MIFIPVALLLFSNSAFAQLGMRIDNTPMSLGLYGSFDPAFHTMDFAGVPGVPSCCQKYESGKGSGFSIGGLAILPLSSTFFLQFRAGYSAEKSTTGSDEHKVLNLDGEAVPGTIHHEIETEAGFISLEPQLGVQLGSGIHLLGGLWFGCLVSQSMTQQERLVEPSTGTFNNGLRTRNSYDDEIPDASLFAASATAGIGWTLPMMRGRQLALTPEVRYRFQLTPIVSGLTWQRHTISIGIVASFSLGGSYSFPQGGTPSIRDAERAKPQSNPSTEMPHMLATVDVRGTKTNGETGPVKDLQLEEFVSTELQPLLNYVFFPQGSSEIPERYTLLSNTEASVFRTESLQGGSVLDTYHHLLNIIGRRMTDHPDSRLTLTGCVSGTGVESDNRVLARERAEVVANYLNTAWGIDRSRLVTKYRGIPERPTTSMEGDGPAENRRVELDSDDQSILAPLMLGDTTRVIEPSLLTFAPHVESTSPVSSWSLSVMDEERKVREFTGNGTAPDTLRWDVQHEWADDNRSASRLHYRFFARAVDGNSAGAEGLIRVDQMTLAKKRARRAADIEIDRYNLILFDFGSTTLSDANKRIIEFIRGRIGNSSSISITGFTDRIGEARFNQKLSRDRAQSAADALGLPNTTIRGIGEVDVYPNTLPEGRFYNRTVSITVETPIEP
jgi:outer membrane protein OmpA-like peptidoglycan-associated protein